MPRSHSQQAHKQKKRRNIMRQRWEAKTQPTKGPKIRSSKGADERMVDRSEQTVDGRRAW